MKDEPLLVRADDAPPQPWRNGGGTTRELLALPAGDAWRMRLSVADIERDGPFSAYPGVRRWFAVLQGAGVRLDFGTDGARTLTPADAPLAFDGALAPGCALVDGPTRDLNLMLRDARGTMARVVVGRPWRPREEGAARCGLFAAVAGRCRADGRGHAVPARVLLWFDAAPDALAFEPDAAPADASVGWWIAASFDGDAA
jgi:environmental stress-induced protein Ves